MANNFAQIGARLDLLASRLNFALNNNAVEIETVYQEIAFVDETGIGGKGSELAQYPIRVLSQRPTKKGDTEVRDDAEPVVWNLTAGSSRIDIFSEYYSVSESRDPYGLFKSDAPDALNNAALHWQELCADVINTNPVCYDGTAFFGTHKANAAVANTTDFSNDLTNTDLDEAGIVAGFGLLSKVPGPGGQLVNAMIKDPVVLCGTYEQYRKARKIAQEGALLAKVFGNNAAAAAESTGWGGEFKPIFMPQLSIPGGDSLKRWYPINRASTKRRPLIVRVTSKPRFEIDLSEKGKRNAIRVFAWAEGDVAPGLPHSIVRCTAP